MAIQSITNKANNVVLPSKPTQSGKVTNTNSQATEKAKDSVDITAVAKEITKAFETSKSTPVINEERVNAVKKALEEGTYPINAEKIAAKMVQMEREQFYNS
ncbi:MAG: flagellar biosynthesis anti-sigma factor FlgM [Methylococcales bacterium]|nr:flagellar biosynthesis anti-sigma factor FlgM [Methylococcales bacterium]